MKLAAHAGDGDEIPELASRLGQVKRSIRKAETELALAQDAASSSGQVIQDVEAAALRRLESLGTAFSGDRTALREAFMQLSRRAALYTRQGGAPG